MPALPTYYLCVTVKMFLLLPKHFLLTNLFSVKQGLDWLSHVRLTHAHVHSSRSWHRYQQEVLSLAGARGGA